MTICVLFKKLKMEDILAGGTSSFGAGLSDIWLIKTDSNGTEEWNKTLGGNSNDYAYSVNKSSDGGYIIAGYTNSSDPDRGDAWLIKTDSNGTEKWNRTFGGIYYDFAYAVQELDDGGYAIAGHSGYGGAFDGWLIKTDSNGTIEWKKTFGGPYVDFINSAQKTRDGGLILVGSTWQTSDSNNITAWLIKTDSNGTEEWNKTFEGESNYANFNSVQETSDGGYILAGETDSGTNAWIVKVGPENQVVEDSKIILPVANFSSNVTSGYAPLSVQFTDLSKNVTYRTWYFGDGTTSTDGNPSHTYSAEGIYNVNLVVSNANRTASKPATITVLSQSSSDGGSSNGDGSSGGSSHSSGSEGGGGGGAGGSLEPQSNVEAKEISQAFITSGSTVKFSFPIKVTPVVYVSFYSKKTVGKTTTIAETLRGKSILVSGLFSGEVYKYLNIWVGNGRFGDSDNIVNTIVCFKVEKSWIQDKKIDQSSITLNRYSDKKWNLLSTNLSGEDDKYLYFTAKVLGFSSFAITGKTKESGTAVEPATGNKILSAVDDTQNNAGNRTANIDQTSESTQNSNNSKKESTKSPDFEIVSGIICLLSVFLYKRR
jgi:PGF-pre-PGF domain-containing protein